VELQTTWIAVAAGIAIGLLAGIGLGRRAGRGAAKRARDLEDQLMAAEDEMKRYRAQVSDHFSETSKLLRDLTLQYRNVYEHLADGARTLCPDGATLLAPSLAEAALPASASALHPPASEPDEIDDQLDLDLQAAARATTPARSSDALGPLLDEAEPGWARSNGDSRPS
jgi:uncharacterized membrane-anchored protein YhcB (DUF1043 family)